MKKIVFISMPMRHRTKENIESSFKKARKLATTMLKEPDVEISFINTKVKARPPKESNERMWYLGESIKLLSKADILITFDCPYFLEATGVETEERVFRSYSKNPFSIIQLPVTTVMTREELYELRDNYEKKEVCGCMNQTRGVCDGETEKD